MLHYNFPPFSVGETGRMGSQSRREIGHGNLAERALKMVAPDYDKFPYVIRIVSEVLESNGSSSMGTVCSGTLAMLDAGVPIKGNVAGIAMGLITDGNKYAILSDILGDEDHLGDMDFKVAGTKDGITALQMDIKIDSLTFEILEKALAQAKDGRIHILNEMEKTISVARGKISDFAPRIETIHINPEKVREVIGAGGKVIKGIIEQTGVKIDIEDDGRVHVASSDPQKAKKAIQIIMDICAEAEVGKVYRGKVVKVVDFGAFVEVLPNMRGLLHISEIAHERIRQVTDVLNEGDEVEVKVLEVDRSGKIKLSRKALLERST
jgi:polyribonucleotide nucleotidyltransferase